MNNFSYSFSLSSLPPTGITQSISIIPSPVLEGNTGFTFVMADNTDAFYKAIFQFSDTPEVYDVIQAPIFSTTGVKGLSAYHTFAAGNFTFTLSCFRRNLVLDTFTFAVSVFPIELGNSGLSLVNAALFDTTETSDNMLLTLELPSRELFYLVLSGKQIT